ncbi:MAG: choice-of-anchor Q domain-containing protein [Acidimicrobiia bacterium]
MASAARTLPGLAGSDDLQAQALSFGQVRGDGGITLFGTVLRSPIGVFGNCAETATVASAGYNFADDTSCTLTGTGDRQGAGLDPQLGALAFNGGPTQTMAITQSSPLFDAIPEAACQSGPAVGVTTDQRGVARPSYTGCDIGAFEIESPVPVNIAPRFTG